MKIFQHIAAFGLLTSIAFTATAQETRDTIQTGNIEIVKEYTPFVEDGKKQSFQPVMPTVEQSERGNLNYNMPSAFIETQYQPDDLQPLPYAGESARFVRTGYVKAGYGTSKNPLAKFAINAMQDNNYTIGVRGGFQAVKGDLVDKKMSDTNLEVFGTKEITNATLDASIAYNRNENQLYGYDHTNPLLSTIDYTSDRAFNTVTARTGLESANTDPYAVRHKTHANFDILNEKAIDISEMQIGLETVLSKRIVDGLDAQLSADITTRNSKNEGNPISDFKEQKETVLNFTPSIKPSIEGINAELGASINNDKEHEVKIFPHVKVEIPLSNDQFTVFAGWTGRTMMNGYQQIQSVNPRLAFSGYTKNYTKEQRTPIGLRGTLSDQFSFSASINQDVMKNAPLWVNDISGGGPLANRSFTTVYDEKLTAWRPNLAANFQFGETVSVVSDISYNFYSTETYAEAWQLPELDATLSLNVRPIEQLQLTGDIQGLTGINFMLSDGTTGKLDGIFNANLGAQFDVNEQFGIFIDANNLANSDVEIWKNYPAVGTNILAGIVFSLD